jgi:hypothetical protein
LISQPRLRASAGVIVMPGAETNVSSRELHSGRPRSLRVLPRPRGSWIVATGRGDVLSEHATATEAERAGYASLREGEELLVFDRYHRCRRRARHEAPSSHRSRRAG